MLSKLFFNSKNSHYDSETLNILRLIRSENVGPKTFFALMELFGDINIALENVEEFSLRGGRKTPIKLYSLDNVKKELDLLDKAGAKIISYKSDKYSKLLQQISDFPPILTYKGNIELLNKLPVIAIVGSRNASINAEIFTQKISKALADKGIIVVSGLARGIDAAAHKVCPNNTIAVIAGGIDHIYPQENAKLYQAIIEQGLLLAELPIGSAPLSKHFPQRNRIISGLSLGTLVIEASIHSGSLITAKYALEQGREVFAVPGFPLEPRSRGTNKLIKEGAYLIESVDDIIENLPNYLDSVNKIEDADNQSTNFKISSKKDFSMIDDKMRESVVSKLSVTPIDFEILLNYSDLPLEILCVILLELELAGRVIRCSGNRFCLNYE